MSFCLEVKLVRKERAFERVVGLVGRRGYEVIGVSAELADEGAAMSVLLTLESDRSPELLARHVAKLREVTVVRLA